jgi:hypothetical protein
MSKCFECGAEAAPDLFLSLPCCDDCQKVLTADLRWLVSSDTVPNAETDEPRYERVERLLKAGKARRHKELS